MKGQTLNEMSCRALAGAVENGGRSGPWLRLVDRLGYGRNCGWVGYGEVGGAGLRLTVLPWWGMAPPTQGA